MAVRVCPTVGCPVLTDGRHCATHRREREQARGSRQTRGYGAGHEHLRAGYQARMDKGERFTCWRCGGPVHPVVWVLGHCDDDRSRYHGPECPPCNNATAGRAGERCPHPSHLGPNGRGGISPEA